MAGNGKSKSNILPILVLVIIVFLAYKANPEYWQQGRLLEDWKNGGQKKVEVSDVANVPETPKEVVPQVDPNAILPGSVKGAKTVPINVINTVNQNDQAYWLFRIKFKTVYLVYPSGTSGDKYMADIQTTLERNGFKGEWTTSSLRYDNPKDKKTKCSASPTINFLCQQCDRKVCLINPNKSEILVVAPTVQATMARVKSLSKGAW